MKNRIDEAYDRIKPFIYPTPLIWSPELSNRSGARVFLKPEYQQRSGSFKIRGVLNKILAGQPWPMDTFFFTASTGNHAAAVAEAFRLFELRGKIFMPENVSQAKLNAIRESGIPVELRGLDCVETEQIAAETATDQGGIYISPYNDAEIIEGQGTVAVELFDEIPELDAVLVPVGGGGLASGVGAYAREVRPDCQVVGCQPENSAIMYESVRAGRIVTTPSLDTVSDATAGGIEAHSVTFDICRQVISRFLLFNEREISAAIRLMLESHQILIEGGAALTVAALMHRQPDWQNKNVVAILTGKKIALKTLMSVLDEG